MNEAIYFKDDVLPNEKRREVNNLLHKGGASAPWVHGWKSREKVDTFSFWHRHFAGYRSATKGIAYDCEAELAEFPVIHEFWQTLAGGLLHGHRLVRCYANGLAYGSDGTLHTDTRVPNSYTTIYYPHESWNPDWGGETVFFNREKDDILTSIYPRPNRLLMFDGTLPHVARGVSRSCPLLRVTLMFKTDKHDAGPQN
jgi:SM-20-related protein